MKFFKTLLPIFVALSLIIGVSAADTQYGYDSAHKWEIMVNGTFLDTEKLPFSAYEVGGDDVWDVMVPLRAVCEQLGYVVTWDDATKTVTVDDSIQILKLYDGCMAIEIIGKFNLFTLDRLMPLAFPVINHNGYVYVPLSLFTGIFTNTSIDSNVISISTMFDAS